MAASRPVPGEVWRAQVDGKIVRVQILADRYYRHPTWVAMKLLEAAPKTKVGDEVVLPPPGTREAGSRQWRGRVRAAQAPPARPAPAPAPPTPATRPRRPAAKPLRKTDPQPGDVIVHQRSRRGHAEEQRFEVLAGHRDRRGVVLRVLARDFDGGEGEVELIGPVVNKLLRLTLAKKYGYAPGSGRVTVVPPRATRALQKRGLPVGRAPTLEEQAAFAREFPTFARPLPPELLPPMTQPTYEKPTRARRAAPSPAIIPAPGPATSPWPAPTWPVTAGRPDWITGDPRRSAAHLAPHPGDAPTRPPVFAAGAVPPEARLGQAILELMGDGRARTFNTLALDLAGPGSGTAGGPIDRVLWDLVEKGFVEHTTSVPVLFRLRQPGTVPAAAGAPAPEPGDLWIVTEQGVSWPGEVVSYDPTAAPLGGLVEVRAAPGGRAVGEPQLMLRTQLVRLLQKGTAPLPGEGEVPF